MTLRREAADLTPGSSEYMASVDARLAEGCAVYMSSPSELFLVDTASAAAQKVGPFGQEITDIALAPDGTLYGVAGNQQRVYRIDRSTAQATEIGRTGAWINGLTATADGKLYGSGEAQIYLVDPSKGSITVALEAGTYQSSGDLTPVGPDSMLYASSALVRIDLAAKTLEPIGTAEYEQVWGLAMTPSGLFGCLSYGALLLIDPATGEYQALGKPLDACWGMA